MQLAPRLRRVSGFTAIELLITISMLGILMALALPSFREWIVNARIRTTAEVLQNNLRLAQAEALRRNRVVVFALTNATPAANATAFANARNWMIQTIGVMTGESAEFVQGGTFTDAQGAVAVAGNGATCFNSMGRLVPVAGTATGVSAACTVPTTGPAIFDVTATGSTNFRPLRVTVTVGGQVRMCDMARAGQPDGC